MPDPKIKWQYARTIQSNIVAALKNKEESPSFEDIDQLIKGMRTACQETIFMDFQFAVDEEVETHLWNTHGLIKQRFKKLVDYYRDNMRERKVERRKYEKRYVDFIKETRFFYTGYIQRLASHFGGIEGLNRIAQCMSLNRLSVDTRIDASPHIKHLVQQSCHTTLLRLGDLSRYRNEIRLTPETRSWEGALGFYGLAADLCPDSGSSHNQMAVIALADQNHLDALYHLYRAIAVKEPHPLATKNLEVEFRKITTLWEKSPVSRSKTDNESTLTLWFVRLHAKLFKGVVFTGHNELESEVLSRLPLLLKEDKFEAKLEKFVIVNIAAGYYAEERVKEQGEDVTSEAIQSFYFFLRLNVRFFHVLLQTLHPEIEDSTSGQDIPNGVNETKPNDNREMFTAIARRILPALRQYSTWLVSQSNIIINVPDNAQIQLHLHIKAMWSLYAEVMSRTVKFFPTGDLPTVSYLLKEDESTIGFKPFRDPEIACESNLYVDGNNNQKCRLSDKGVKRSSPDTEMLARVRDILLCALTLQCKDSSPIKVVTDTAEFSYVENDTSVQAHAGNVQSSKPTIQSPPALSSSPVKPEDSASQIAFTQPEKFEAPASRASIDTYMHDMVDNLVDNSNSNQRTSSRRISNSHRTGNETSYGMHSRTANEIFAPMASNGVYTHQGTPDMLPSLNGIWQTAFTPKPNELQPTSPERLSTGRPPFQYASRERQLAAADALDAITGQSQGSGLNGYSWDSQRLGSNSVAEQPLARVLHDSLTRRYFPSQSSAFTDGSSIYGNPTPARYGNNPIGTRSGAFAPSNGNNTTAYAGASHFDQSTMLNSSIWDGSQRAQGAYSQTPPGGQGG